MTPYKPWFRLGLILPAVPGAKPKRWYFPDPLVYRVDKIGWRIGVGPHPPGQREWGFEWHDREENVATAKSFYVNLWWWWVLLKLYNWKKTAENPGVAQKVKEESR